MPKKTEEEETARADFVVDVFEIAFVVAIIF